MIHLICTTIPLQEIPERDRDRLLSAVINWGDNHSFSENDPKPNFNICRIGKGEEERLEWRRIYSDVLHIPNIELDFSLSTYGSTTRWSWYVESVAVATNVQFRKNKISRFSGYNDKTRSSISEFRDSDGLNRLSLSVGRKADLGHAAFQMDQRMLQDQVVFFLETAAIYHLAHQAKRMAHNNMGNPVVVAMYKKLERIMGICTSEEYAKRHKPHEDQDEEIELNLPGGWYR